jgi:periplasmic divalent cation tolerance protein
MATDARVVLVTVPSTDQGMDLARVLVEEKLAACVNLVPAVRSIYRWEGKVREDSEALLIVKTTSQAFERLRARLVSLHPYQCPEVLALAVDEGHRPYLDWVRASVG